MICVACRDTFATKRTTRVLLEEKIMTQKYSEHKLRNSMGAKDVGEKEIINNCFQLNVCSVINMFQAVEQQLVHIMLASVRPVHWSYIRSIFRVI